jgi:uncharacterized protein
MRLVTDSSPSTAISAAPGWYYDSTALRWWDGTTWGPYAPTPQPQRPTEPAERIEPGSLLAVVCHVGFFVLPVILPLIIRRTRGRKDDFVRHHSTEALHFQLKFVLFFLATFIATGIAGKVTLSGDDTVNAWTMVTVLVMVAGIFIAGTSSVVGAVRARQGRLWQYPLSFESVRWPRRSGGGSDRSRARVVTLTHESASAPVVERSPNGSSGTTGLVIDASPSTTPRSGWYDDGTALRWWDGAEWGPFAPGWGPTDAITAGRTMAVISHIPVPLPIVSPLVIRATKGRKNDFVRHNSTEALNFQLTLAVVEIAIGGSTLVISSAVAPDDGAVGSLVLLPSSVASPVFIAGVFLMRVAVNHARKGEWWRYPVSIRFVRGARPSDS